MILGLRRRTRDIKPEEKVELAIERSDMCMQGCATGTIRQNPDIDEKNLFKELRKRVECMVLHL